ncbi:unnamed protein product [Phaeothamnion confervicola]
MLLPLQLPLEGREAALLPDSFCVIDCASVEGATATPAVRAALQRWLEAASRGGCEVVDPSLPENTPAAVAERFRASAAEWQTPTLVVPVGIPGSGKSRMAALLRERLGATVVSSDRIRMEAAGKAEEAVRSRSKKADGAGSGGGGGGRGASGGKGGSKEEKGGGGGTGGGGGKHGGDGCDDGGSKVDESEGLEAEFAAARERARKDSIRTFKEELTQAMRPVRIKGGGGGSGGSGGTANGSGGDGKAGSGTAEARGDPPPPLHPIVFRDKNLPEPTQYYTVFEAAPYGTAVCLAFGFSGATAAGAGHLDLAPPLTNWEIAVCMQRTLSRDHHGGVDARLPQALTVVLSFAATLCNADATRRTFLARLADACGDGERVLCLPICSDMQFERPAPPEIAALIDEGLDALRSRGRGHGHGSRRHGKRVRGEEDEALPVRDGVPWEQRMRDALRRHAAEVAAVAANERDAGVAALMDAAVERVAEVSWLSGPKPVPLPLPSRLSGPEPVLPPPLLTPASRPPAEGKGTGAPVATAVVSLAAGVAAGASATPAAGRPAGGWRRQCYFYYSLDVPAQEVNAALEAAFGGRAAVDAFLAASGLQYDWGRQVPRHCTLAFDARKTAPDGLLRALHAHVGHPAGAAVAGLACDGKVGALELAGFEPPELGSTNAHPHITLAMAPGVGAKHSNKMLESEERRFQPARGTVAVAALGGSAGGGSGSGGGGGRVIMRGIVRGSKVPG